MKNITNGSINYSGDSGYPEKETFYLNHSCDEWIIGDLESAKKFAEDLLKTIKEVESNLTPISSMNTDKSKVTNN